MNVLITGAASGIGYALMKEFISHDHFVIGLDINEIKNEKCLTFKCDITNEESLSSILNELKRKEIKLDAIVNIAGVHLMASLVETDPQKMKKLLDINLYGTMLVNRVFYECLAEKGKIIILSSEVANYDPLPFNGLYNISKTALEAYAQALRQELNLFGQMVISICPGSIETPLSKGSITGTEELVNSTKLYKKQSKHFLHLVTKFMGKPLKPSKLAKKMYKIINKKHPKYIYTIHPSIGLVLLNILPKRMQCAIIKMLLNK